MQRLLENPTITIGSAILFLIFLINVFEIKRCTNTKTVPFAVLLSLATIMLLLPFLIAILTIFILYRQMIYLILKIKSGSQYAVLLRGADAFHMVDDPSHSIIHCLLMMKCLEKRTPEDFFNTIKPLVWKLHRYSKFKMILHKSMGYFYMEDGDLSADDCIRRMKLIDCNTKKVEKKDFLTLLNECCNEPLPKNQMLPWEVLVGTQPIKWKEDEADYYPLLFRINHTVADGTTLMKLGIALADKQEQDVTTLPRKSFKPSKYDKYNTDEDCLKVPLQNIITIVTDLLNVLITSLKPFLLAPASLVVNFMLKAKDCNILHGSPLTGQKMLTLSVEHSQEYFLRTKQIKNKVPGTKFSEVLITAFSASLTDYFKKNTANPPYNITATIPVFPDSLEVQHLTPGHFDVGPGNVGNGYSFLLMNLPIAENDLLDTNSSLIKRLELIKKEINVLRHSVDYHVNYFMMSFFCSIVPYPVARFILNRKHCSTIVSILPAARNVSCCDGSMIVENVFSWVPHLHNIGTTILISTHNDQIHIGFSVDKALITSQDVAQDIVDGVYKYLDLLAEEMELEHSDE